MIRCSALPWKACPALGRIQHRRRPGLAALALGNPRTVCRGGGAFFRAQSTDTGTGTGTDADATKPAKPSAENAPADTAALSSLINRLRDIPVQPHGADQSIVVKPVTPYPHKREDREALKKHHRALTQQLLHERRRQQDTPGDWRSILQNLIRWTPIHTRPRDLKVMIPRHSAGILSTDHERNLWNIRSRTGCNMTLCRPTDEKANIDPYVILSGQPAAISAAVDEILKAIKGITVVNMQRPPEMGVHGDQAGVDASAVTRTVIHPHQMSVPCRRYRLTTRADRIPRPSKWTVEAFQQYTAALVKGHMDASLARRLYPKGTTHKDTVVRQLRAVFNDPAASAAVSLPALKIALEYLAAAGETHINDSLALVERVEALGLRMDTDIYNRVAETAIHSKYLLAFECTVSQMIVRGHRPNLRTWLLFLRLVESEEIRRYILEAMDTKNFFSNPAVVIRVSGIMADHDAYRAIQRGQDWDAFLAALRELYGPEWRLDQSAAVRYLDVFGRYSKFDDMRRLLEDMFASRQARPNAVALNTIITHCKHQRKVDLAVAFVRMFDERGYHIANQITFHLLFKLARKTRKPHLLSAVWRYAHRREMTDYYMRDYGIQLLAGQPWLLQLTNQIQGLWEEPHNCKITKQAFIENLLLCDYHPIGQTASNAQPLVTNGRITTKKSPDATSLPPSSDDDTSTPAPETATPDSEAGQGRKKASVSIEAWSAERTTWPTKGNKALEPRPIPRSYILPAAPGEETVLQQQQAGPSMSAAEKYELYAKAMSKQAEEWVPTTWFGKFLQAALDCDRRLHRLVHGKGDDDAEGEEPPMAYRGGVPVDMYPVKLRIARREPAPTNAMLQWLADKKMEERAAGVVPDSEDQENFIDVMGKIEDEDGEHQQA
jgi:hypothetical protein